MEVFPHLDKMSKLSDAQLIEIANRADFRDVVKLKKIKSDIFSSVVVEVYKCIK